MANLHSDLHSTASLCPTVDLWPTWTFPPAARATSAASGAGGVAGGFLPRACPQPPLPALSLVS